MPVELVTLSCRTDNYAFLIHNPATGQTALIDAPQAAPVQSALRDRGWTLTDLLITHHHDDHIDGVAALRGPGVRVIGAAADHHRLPALDLALRDGDRIDLCGEPCVVMDVSGHTVGHIAFYLPQSGIVFTADSLMALGCGRLFEGTPDQMWQSLSRLRALPPETIVCSGHEYTASNAAFALTVDPDNPALKDRVAQTTSLRKAGQPTVPSVLSLELATNPFLRADDPAIRAHLNLQQAPDAQVFAHIRALKDRF